MPADGAPTLLDLHGLPPAEIERKSFEIIRSLLSGYDHSAPEWAITCRVVHTTGDPAAAELLQIHPDAIAAGVAALRAGRTIITDTRMVAAGLSMKMAARWGCQSRCAIDLPEVAELAKAGGITRGAAAMRYLAQDIPGGIVAIGNAPTALFALLDYIDAGGDPPALIVGTPVGFVGAAESKAELVSRAGVPCPYIALEGTRGGSAIAATIVNALIRLADEEVN